MKVQILIDNKESWILLYAKEIVKYYYKKGIDIEIIYSHNKLEKSDILILLSCEKILKNLSLAKNTLVVHESNLPEGKGWSPVSWQVLEGKNNIIVTLFEADLGVDSGNIYYQEKIELNGNELIDEIRKKQGNITIKLVKKFINNYPYNIGKKQVGKESFYKRRTYKDSELNINKTIKEQFNLLRICDNERYPAFFQIHGDKYILKIYKNEK